MLHPDCSYYYLHRRKASTYFTFISLGFLIGEERLEWSTLKLCQRALAPEFLDLRRGFFAQYFPLPDFPYFSAQRWKFNVLFFLSKFDKTPPYLDTFTYSYKFQNLEFGKKKITFQLFFRFLLWMVACIALLQALAMVSVRYCYNVVQVYSSSTVVAL